VIELLQRAKQESGARGSKCIPVLSPADSLLSGADPAIKFKAVQAAGFPVIVWTVNNPARMRELIEQRIDGIISDRPDLLRQELMNAQKDQGYFARFNAQGHRGGRDLRPENTLPAFEAGLDNLITTIETDTGVTADRVSLISHEQFINPQTCRHADGSPYTEANRVWIKDITMAEAQKRFICDRTFRGPQQKNDLVLSPVAVAFAQAKGLNSPYAPTNVEQLFDFAAYYVEYYKSGAGKSHPGAEARWRNAAKVRFNLETKITPASTEQQHTFGPDIFVKTLCGAIKAKGMEARSDIQSFDFRTLTITRHEYPEIQTVFLLEK
ncbi:MAG: glycerophosphodiester phosphodiesterase family protein, partial [Bryobacteraceae bacterium]